MKKYDIVIIGGGITGLCVAYQLLERGITNNILIIEKENRLGAHTSGRNSGVMHAGLYYKPGTIKAAICTSGKKRLEEWILERGLPINKCGKIVVPTKLELDSQLDVLQERGRQNGAVVEMWDTHQLKAFDANLSTASGRCLWSPKTSVIKPMRVVRALQNELEKRGVVFEMAISDWKPNKSKNELDLGNGMVISYGYLFNCSGLFADKVAHTFNVGLEFSLMPFKGIYWQLKQSCPFKPKCNVYPVPDLSVPFLGIHFTPSADGNPTVSIGPTATLALGRENYDGLTNLDPILTGQNIITLANQYLANKGNVRRYVKEQAFLHIFPLMVREVKKLIPNIQDKHIEKSNKVAIRPQLYNHKTGKLEDDFVCMNGKNSTHVLNAISPAFTASFALGDLIIDRSTIDCKHS